MENRNQLTVNDVLTLHYQDGFHVMSAEEKRQLTALGEGPAEALKDPDRHVIITLGWKKVSRLISTLFSADDAADAIRKSLRKPMAAFGYHGERELSRTIAGEHAGGIGYEYKTQGIAMYGESYVIKLRNYYYYFHIYTRAEYKDENLQLWNEILDSVSL